MNAQKTILIADDEADIVETLDFALRRRGYHVEVAQDGETATAMAKADPPDLMLLDVMLPGQNGYEVSRQLKDWMALPGGKDFPIMLVTARRLSSVDREEFVATWSRADAVMYKPFALDRLMENVEELLVPAEAALA